jgi:hypothetical protein
MGLPGFLGGDETPPLGPSGARCLCGIPGVAAEKCGLEAMWPWRCRPWPGMMQGRDGGRWQLWTVARATTGAAVGLILTGHAVPEVDRDVK